MENNIGWIKLYRKLIGSSVWTYAVQASYPPLTHLFVYLLLSANYGDKLWFDGKQEVVISAGSLVTSLEKLSKDTGLSIQTTRTCLSHLSNMKIITSKSTNKWTQVWIVNWGKYQDYNVTDNMQDNNQSTNKQQTANNPLTTTKEVKNIRREENSQPRSSLKAHEEKNLSNGQYPTFASLDEAVLHEIEKKWSINHVDCLKMKSQLEQYYPNRNQPYKNFKAALETFVDNGINKYKTIQRQENWFDKVDRENPEITIV